MNKGFALWVVWFVFLLVLGFAVPFVALDGIGSLAGAFTFWIGWALVAILSMGVAVHRWRDSPDDEQAGD